jgi:hypothetical protein
MGRFLLILKKNVFLLILVFILGIFLGKSISIVENIYDRYTLNPGTYDVLVKLDVLNLFKTEYTQKEKRFYCLEGYIDEINKLIYVESAEFIGNEKVVERLESQCDSLGVLHTHAKTFSLFPICELSGTDEYKFGLASEKEDHILGGVICSKDRIALYLTNSENEPERHKQNKKIPYTVLE